MKEEELFSVLFKAAEASPPSYNAKIASVIVHKKKIVSFGFNRMKSHPFQKKYSKRDSCIFLHSEVDSIKNSLRSLNIDELKKSSLYICRVKRQGREGPYIAGKSLPCAGCLSCIKAFGIKTVYYTEDGSTGFVCL